LACNDYNIRFSSRDSEYYLKWTKKVRGNWSANGRGDGNKDPGASSGKCVIVSTIILCSAKFLDS